MLVAGWWTGPRIESFDIIVDEVFHTHGVRDWFAGISILGVEVTLYCRRNNLDNVQIAVFENSAYTSHEMVNESLPWWVSWECT